MLQEVYRSYIGSFSGLRKEVWLLALITLINRAGTMVIPFLSLYLTKDKGFSLEEVGWILSIFGLGSVAGSWLGGKFTDSIGHYKTMAGSLLISSILFILLQFPTSFLGFSIGIFLVMLAADAFRPAVFVAISAYSKPENRTRSVSLIRLAINLGFSAGPAIGGLIIAKAGYGALFWVDGITCFIAGLLLLQLLHPKKARQNPPILNLEPTATAKDKVYMTFLVALMLFGFIFIQYFSTMPLFYSEGFKLLESEIGILLGLNGFMIFLFEMPLIKFLESRKFSDLQYVIAGSVLTGVSFLVINLSQWTGILVVGMLLVTLGEMIAFPFSNSFALKRSDKGKQGAYMALYSIAFSLSHIFGHNTGMQLIDNFGFRFTWMTMAILSVIVCALLIWTIRLLKRETEI
ncbi:MDR family MFS transporter [Salegentibacter chungangensis]|uniref:MDR family MFS transporter n=1 Tax=Salegentibacter chungangensis TaxID=1335724 RepID=A0ABW3NRQ8_9FLAO